jgi:hypothetical protein
MLDDELAELRQRIRTLPDEELWQMVNIDFAEYRQVALEYAKAEIKARGLFISPLDANNETRFVGPYSTRWSDYKRRRNLFWLVFLTYIPGVVILGIPLSKLLHADSIVFVIVALWMLAFVVVGNYWGFWKCPRCGKPFFRKWWYHNSFARKCVHCKLPKWSLTDPDASPKL